MLKFNIDKNYFKQDFSIPSPIIRYVMINADSKNLKKLHKTCKYFYARQEKNIVDNLCLGVQNNREERYKYFLTTNQIDQLPNNLWLAGYFLLGNVFNLSKLFPKIIKCDLKTLYIGGDVKIKMNEFAILTQSKTIKTCVITPTISLKYDDHTPVPLEDVLSHLLGATYIRYYCNCYVTENTMKNLLLLNFHEKLTYFSLSEISQMLDVNLMEKFLLKNLGDKAYVKLNHENEDENRLFISQMFEKINAWSPEERKPWKFPKFFTVE